MVNENINLKIQQLAIKLYGLHRAYIPLGFSENINRILQSKMQKYANEIEQLGGTIQTSTDGISKTPKIQNLDRKTLPYDMGRLECERINDYIRENLNEFIELY